MVERKIAYQSNGQKQKNEYIRVKQHIEISYKVGYSSYAHFSVKFREMFGIPPKEYLKQHRHDMYSTITTKIID